MNNKILKRIMFILKIISFLYIIPLYNIIGLDGGIRYGYIYIIMLFFIILLGDDISNYFAEIINEYNKKDYHYTKNLIFKIGLGLFFIIGLILFVILFLTTDFLTQLIFGTNLVNNIGADISKLLKFSSLIILLLPIYETLKGYLKGCEYDKEHNYLIIVKDASLILISLSFTYLVINIFSKSINNGLYALIFSIIISYIFAISYGLFVIIKNRDNLGLNIKKTRGEVKVNIYNIFKDLFINISPLIFIKLILIGYLLINNILVIKILVNYFKYSIKDTNIIMSVINLWGLKINNIIVILSIYIFNKIIKQSLNDSSKDIIRNKINKVYQIILYILIPLILTLSIFSKEIWIVLYQYNDLSISTFSIYVFESLFVVIFLITMFLLYYFKQYRIIITSCLIGLLLKILLTASLMLSFYKMGHEPYIGIFISSIIGYTITIIIGLRNIYLKYKLNISETVLVILNIIFSTIITVLALLVIKIILNIESKSSFVNLILIIVYMIVGANIYQYLNKKNKTLTNINNISTIIL